jgi:hypothetical protein
MDEAVSPHLPIKWDATAPDGWPTASDDLVPLSASGDCFGAGLHHVDTAGRGRPLRAGRTGGRFAGSLPDRRRGSDEVAHRPRPGTAYPAPATSASTNCRRQDHPGRHTELSSTTPRRTAASRAAPTTARPCSAPDHGRRANPISAAASTSVTPTAERLSRTRRERALVPRPSLQSPQPRQSGDERVRPSKHSTPASLSARSAPAPHQTGATAPRGFRDHIRPHRTFFWGGGFMRCTSHPSSKATPTAVRGAYSRLRQHARVEVGRQSCSPAPGTVIPSQRIWTY